MMQQQPRATLRALARHIGDHSKSGTQGQPELNAEIIDQNALLKRLGYRPSTCDVQPSHGSIAVNGVDANLRPHFV